jgi:signal peptidase I
VAYVAAGQGPAAQGVSHFRDPISVILATFVLPGRQKRSQDHERGERRDGTIGGMRRASAALAVSLLLAPACSRATGGTTYSIPSQAMEPTLRRGDRVGCSTDVPDALKRGMVVVFEGNEKWVVKPGPTFVKRVIGLPGERVESTDGKVVLVDGAPIAEPYLSGTDEPTTFEAATVPDGQYWVMGDNRDGSSDSRFNGAITHESIEAVCTKIVSPRERKGRIPGT